MDIVLASGSPRRRELLTMLGLRFDVEVPDVDESRHPDEEPAPYVERVARLKAGAAAGSGRLVIAADTAVVFDGHVLGKPAHPAEARAMLAALAGETHAVYTGVAVAADGVMSSTVERSLVRLLPLTDEEVAGYVSTGEPMDKAGAYALQGLGSVFVESVEGSPTNVIGFPMHVVARLLRAHGVDLLAH
jgi:septum formation protein